MHLKKMKMSLERKIISSLILMMLCCVFVVATACANVANDVKHVDFWLSKLQNADTIIMNAGEIKTYNQEMIRKLPNSSYDLTQFPSSISGEDLRTYLQQNDFPEGYVNGQKMSPDFKSDLLDANNVTAVQEQNTVHWGIAIRRSSLRIYPTEVGIFDTAKDKDFDSLQATIVNPCEALTILHKSPDKKWLFVQSNNYRGWILADNVAEATSEEWLKWQNGENFLVVTAANITIKAESEKILLEMGARLPIVGKEGNDYIVELPRRQEDGQVYFIKSKVPSNSNVNVGYLPYTRTNILKQAFAFYGQPYGWGGLKNSVDCSSLIMDVYRCFGFMMPRDADTQEVAVGKVITTSPEGVKATLETTLPGASLHMDGHVMLYLGRVNGNDYVINSVGSYGDSHKVGKDGLLARVPVMKVVVTDINQTMRRNGKSFMDNLRTIKEWEYERKNEN